MITSTQAELPALSAGVERTPIIGIYGIPGAGKTFLLSMLKQKLNSGDVVFYEGSQLITSTTPGGLKAFQALDEQEKTRWRQIAINSVAKKHAGHQQVVVVAGHYMFWKEGEEIGHSVMTLADLETYTHIVYLDIPADAIVRRRKQDLSRNRPEESTLHLIKWQQAEKRGLRQLCYDHGILFSCCQGPHLLDQVSLLIQDFRWFTEAKNVFFTRAELDKVFADSSHQLKTLLVMDADKTLAAVDTGELFWKEASKMWPSRTGEDPLKMLFGSKMQYTFTAFRQAMLLYEEATNEQEFNDLCKAVASATTMYPEFVSLLQAVADSDHAGAIIVTCGLRRIWEEILERQGLSRKIKVIGNGRLANGYTITEDIKADLVSQARHIKKAVVCAFGDSPLDLGMLKEANEAIVVVGEEQNRSKSMEPALLNALDNDGLRAHQAVFPHTAVPRLSPDKLPTIQLTGSKLIQDILRLQPTRGKLNMTHATHKNAAKLLMTPMRDSDMKGPALRASHRLVGHYLTTEFLSDICGVEEYTIPHVQGHHVAGHRIRHQNQTLIVPLMRGGEPMAFGINDAMPDAMFLHASSPNDLHDKHVHGCLNVILVDSVVNSGKTILAFVRQIRQLHATVRIVVVAGVVQSGAVSRLEGEACCHLNFRLVALRISENKFTGRGGSDTGNRLFNTTHLD